MICGKINFPNEEIIFKKVNSYDELFFVKLVIVLGLCIKGESSYLSDMLLLNNFMFISFSIFIEDCTSWIWSQNIMKTHNE